MTTAIWWIRRDLRLTDNQALAAALLALISPDAEAEGFQRHGQILGERRIGNSVADKEGGGSHRVLPEVKGKVKALSSLAQKLL